MADYGRAKIINFFWNRTRGGKVSVFICTSSAKSDDMIFRRVSTTFYGLPLPPPCPRLRFLVHHDPYSDYNLLIIFVSDCGIEYGNAGALSTHQLACTVDRVVQANILCTASARCR